MWLNVKRMIIMYHYKLQITIHDQMIITSEMNEIQQQLFSIIWNNSNFISKVRCRFVWTPFFIERVPLKLLNICDSTCAIERKCISGFFFCVCIKTITGFDFIANFFSVHHCSWRNILIYKPALWKCRPNYFKLG